MVYTVLIILIVFASLLMVGIVLIQKSKGGGLAENFAKGNDLASVKQTTDIVEKITWGLMAFIAICCIATAKFSHNVASNVKQPEVQTTTSTPVLPMNAQPNVEGATAAPAPAELPAPTPAN